MSIDKAKLRRFVKDGKLSAMEAAQMAQALDNLGERGSPSGSHAQVQGQVSPAGKLKLRYLSGEIDREEYLRGTRHLAVCMAVLFGVFWLPTTLLIGALVGHGTGGWSAALVGIPASVPFALPGSVGVGAAFGWIMYRWQLLPAAERLAALQEQVDLGTEPLECTRPGQCPTCGAENKRTWTPWHPAMIHWFLNPGLAINELLLGQRVPREAHNCRECKTTFIDCSNCRTSIDAMDWSMSRQFGLWGGMRCVRCDGRIPCMRNALALVIEAPVRLLLVLARPLRPIKGPGRSRSARDTTRIGST